MRVVLAINDTTELGRLSRAYQSSQHEVTEAVGLEPSLLEVGRRLAPDLIVVDGSWLSRRGEFALRALHEEQIGPVVALVDLVTDEMTAVATRVGVMAIVPTNDDVFQVVRSFQIPVARWRDLKHIRKELADEVLARKERGAVQKAKMMLMDSFGLTEPTAYDRLRSAAMKHRMRIGQLAQAVLLTESLGLLLPVESATNAGDAA